MKMTVDRSALEIGLAIASAVVPTRTPKPVLECVRLDVGADAVELTATDDVLGIRYTVSQAQVSEPGKLLLNAGKLTQIVRASTDETLAFETDGESCHIRGRDSHFEVYSQDPDDFPPVAALEGDGDLQLPAGVLADLIGKTIYSAARENTRYAINGLLWEKEGNKLKLVGTDGRRLALASRVVNKGVGEDRRAIIPIRALRVAQHLLTDPEATVTARLTDNQFQMRVGCAHLSSVLVEGNFPRYQDVIPKDCDLKLELPVEEFASAVRRAALLTDQDSKGIRLAFSEGELVLTSRAAEHGAATIRMPINYTDRALEIGFNPVYLGDALNVVGVDTVTLEMKEATRPGLLRAGPDFTYAIMPVSLK